MNDPISPQVPPLYPNAPAPPGYVAVTSPAAPALYPPGYAPAPVVPSPDLPRLPAKPSPVGTFVVAWFVGAFGLLWLTLLGGVGICCWRWLQHVADATQHWHFPF